MSGRDIPKYEDLLWPTLKALEALGGSASVREMMDRIISELDMPDEILNTPYKEGPQTVTEVIKYRAGWARSNLKKLGAATNTKRGVWMITSQGRKLRTEEETKKRVREKQREDGENDRTERDVPRHDDLLWPTLKALEDLGGSASGQEIVNRIASELKLSDEVLDVLHKGGPQTKVEYRAGWARTCLKNIGAVANTERGMWMITPLGRSQPTEEEVRKRDLEWRRKYHQRRQASAGQDDGVDDRDGSLSDEQAWRRDLLERICALTPEKFEQLCRLVLLESGFIEVKVTGRSGDRGIDGVGVLRVNLLSFPILFQCKKFSGQPVTPKDIRDFRGAMSGRVDKGLFITTGRYTKEAQKEAVRDGAPAIDLIDGATLCDLMKDLRLGVETVRVPVHKVKPEFFDDI